MPHNSVAESFQTKKLCSRLSSSEVRCYTENGCFAYFWGPGATYDVHLRLTGKRVVDFQCWLKFFARCYRWGATSEYRLKFDDFAPTRAGFPKISGRRGRLPPTILLLRKLGYMMIFRMVQNSGQIFLPFCHNRTDGRTDRILIARPRLHSIQRGKYHPFHMHCLTINDPLDVIVQLCVVLVVCMFQSSFWAAIQINQLIERKHAVKTGTNNSVW